MRFSGVASFFGSRVRRLDNYRQMRARNHSFKLQEVPSSVVNSVSSAGTCRQDLQVYVSRDSFDWYRTWSASGIESHVGSPSTLIIKGRHYVHCKRSGPDAAEILYDRDASSQDPQGTMDSLFLFLVSFGTSSGVVCMWAIMREMVG